MRRLAIAISAVVVCGVAAAQAPSTSRRPEAGGALEGSGQGFPTLKEQGFDVHAGGYRSFVFLTEMGLVVKKDEKK